MSDRTFTTTLELIVNGHACVHDAEISYEYERAGGDGWNEPRYPESATVCAVTVDGRDFMPFLSKVLIEGLEADCIQHEADEREYSKELAAEAKREEQWA